MNDAAVEPEDEELPEQADADEVDDESEDEANEEAQDKEETEPEESSASKKDDGVQKRIDELTRKFREQERLAEHYRQEFENTRASQPQVSEPGKKLSDFDYDEGKYTEYMVDFAQQEASKRVQESSSRESEARKTAQFSAKESEFADVVQDYHRVTRNPELAITPQMVEALREADDGPEVLYYLGKNPEVARSLATMTPLAMAREIGRIEASKLVKPEPSKTNAPAPTPKIKGDSASSRIKPDSPESDKLSDAEWLKRERKRLAAKDK